jgi:glycosyltransferase involved in cell wall biosynthesis
LTQATSKFAADATDTRETDQRSNRKLIRRVVHLSKHCGYGNGNVHVAVDLACVQAQNGLEVVFISGGGTFEGLLARHGVVHITIEQDQRKPLSLLKSAYAIARLSGRFKPDIFHAHMMGAAVVGYLASWRTGVPLVTTVHNSFDRHSVLMRLGHRVVAVSTAEKQHLLRQGYKPDQVDVVLNAPLNSPRHDKAVIRTGVSLESPSILTICGLHRRKGVFDLITSCADVFRDLPSWRLYIAGEGPDQEFLEEQARSLGVAERVTFLGFVPDPRGLLQQCDIFVLASYADPCSLVIGEARGAGCAIVATAVGGTPEMLGFGQKGRLISPGRPDELARELRSLMTDPIARTELRQASLEGSKLFEVHRLADDYERVYQRAVLIKSFGRQIGQRSISSLET